MALIDTLPKSAQHVQQVLHSKGIEARVVVLPQSTRTAKDAAASIGCEVAQIAKSLVFRRLDHDEPVLVIASGSVRVDERKVAVALGAEIGKADAEFVRAKTGFAIGGIPPVGHEWPIRTFIDERLLSLDPIWAAAGTPHAVFCLTARELVAMTGGEVIAVAD